MPSALQPYSNSGNLNQVASPRRPRDGHAPYTTADGMIATTTDMFGALPQGRIRATRNLAIQLGLEFPNGRTIFDAETSTGQLLLNTGYGNPCRVNPAISSAQALSRQQLLELSEYFGIEVSQTTIRVNQNTLRFELRFGHIDATGRYTCKVAAANVMAGEAAILYEHTQPGNGAHPSASLASWTDHMVATNPFGVGLGIQRGVPNVVITRNWNTGRVTTTIALPQLPGTQLND